MEIEIKRHERGGFDITNEFDELYCGFCGEEKHTLVLNANGNAIKAKCAKCVIESIISLSPQIVIEKRYEKQDGRLCKKYKK